MARELLLNRFIVDGIHHEFLPGAFEELEDDEYGVRRMSDKVLSGERFVTTVQKYSDTNNPYIHQRKIHRQAWGAEWGADSFMDLEMYDHLRTLYTLQKPFWLQYDDVMSREGAQLYNYSNDYKAYFTPTYPIAPFGHTPIAPLGYEATVVVNNQVKFSGFTIDSEIGCVRFDTALTASDEVFMAYTWKSYVIINKFNLECKIAQDLYEGSIVFEQIRPNYTSNPWNITIPRGLVYGEGVLNPYDDGAYPSFPTVYNTQGRGWGDTRFNTSTDFFHFWQWLNW